jgi:hypothetical protein
MDMPFGNGIWTCNVNDSEQMLRYYHFVRYQSKTSQSGYDFYRIKTSMYILRILIMEAKRTEFSPELQKIEAKRS